METPNQQLDRVEAALRDMLDEGLREIAGSNYWKRLVPPDTRSHVARRFEEQEHLHPRPAWSRRVEVKNRTRLDYCDFSDYERILLQRKVWPTFEPVFVRKTEFERHMTSARRYRNGIKHGRAMPRVARLNGEAAVLWLDDAIGQRRFEDSVAAEAEPTVEDCHRVLTSRCLLLGQRRLYEALVQAFPGGAMGADLAGALEPESDLTGVLDALARRVNRTPGYGKTHAAGTDMVVERYESDEGAAYRLRPAMLRALRRLRPPWLSPGDLSAAAARANAPDREPTKRASAAEGDKAITAKPAEIAPQPPPEVQVTVEDCRRVLARRPVPHGQRQLYRALLAAHPTGATPAELVATVGDGRPGRFAGIMGALGKRINHTPGYGRTHHPGTPMLIEWNATESRYRLQPQMVEALRRVSPSWLSTDDAD